MIILKLGGSILTKKDLKDAEVDYTNLNRIANEIKEAINSTDSPNNYNNNYNADSNITNKITNNKTNTINKDSSNNSNNSDSLDSSIFDSSDDFGNSNNLLDDGLIIIHGAGSFGHPPAKKYKIGESFNDNNDEEYSFKRIGFSKTQNEVKKLNTIICEVLINQGIPCVSIPPSSIITTENKRIKSFDIGIIEKYLKEGFVPVIYGDVVIDIKLKIAVLSGDQILQYIAKQIKYINSESTEKSCNGSNNGFSNESNKGLISEEIILATDVDGVYTKNPKRYDDAKLIEELTSLNQIEELDSTTNIDVTGGMIGKIKELLELSEIGIESKIINANKPNNIFNSLKNKEITGTIIK